MIYRESGTISTYESTPDGRMSPITPLNYFQEIAQRQLVSLGLGFEFMEKKGLAWILVKYEIDYHAYPKAEEKIVLETEPLSINRFEAYRRFAILSEDGKELVSGKSVWMMVDLKTGKIIRINNVEEIASGLKNETGIYRIPRLEALGESDHERTFKVRYFDIDTNHHVNNVKYLNWAIESLPLETVLNYEVKRLRIVYKAQAFYGETVVAKNRQTGPLTYRIDICRENGEVLCEIEITGRKREEPLELRSHD